MEFVVMAGKMKQGITEVVFFKIGVIAPCGIRVGIMAWRELVVIHREKMFWDVSIGRSMGMDSSAITGNGKGIRRNDAALEGRDDRSLIKKLLKESLKIDEDVLILEKASAQSFRDLGMFFRGFLFFAIRFIGLTAVPRGRKKFCPFIKSGTGTIPEPAHKVIIGTEWRERIRGAADECSKNPVRFEFSSPKGKGKRGKVLGNQKEKKDKGSE